MEFEGMVSDSKLMLKIFELIQKISSIDSPVLIQGESGTGKELVARAIYRRSRRKNAPFIAINCGALPESLLESELFGHEPGAFTGAVGRRKGVFEEANGGTLFLDEIGTTNQMFQVKLLRVLQEKIIRPVGGDREKKVDVRILSASNVDLSVKARNGEFREDLLYRLNVITIQLPPLRDRIDDVPLLARHFAQRAAEEFGVPTPTISSEVYERLMRYAWPGNVRELENTIKRAVLECCVGANVPQEEPREIKMEHLHRFQEKIARNPRKTRLIDVPYREARDNFDKEYLGELLRRFNKNISAAARHAQMSRKQLREKARRLGLL